MSLYETENNKLCIRCKLKEFVYVCSNCHPFTNFCVTCDNFVHTLPSKKNHKRTLMNPDFGSSSKGNNIQKNILNNNYNIQNEEINSNRDNYQPNQNNNQNNYSSGGELSSPRFNKDNNEYLYLD